MSNNKPCIFGSFLVFVLSLVVNKNEFFTLEEGKTKYCFTVPEPPFRASVCTHSCREFLISCRKAGYKKAKVADCPALFIDFQMIIGQQKRMFALLPVVE